jgi:1-deoxy-D-xylulose-5-phosphate reductoisomerase
MTDTIKRNIAILGSTGSIGQQTLDIIRDFPDKFNVAGLAGGENVDVLSEQIREFQPELIYSLNKISPPDNCKVASMEDIATHPQVDLVIIATSGKAGLGPTLSALKAQKQIALANKEILVMAGKIILSEAQKNGITILPVDSEHSAIWQCLQGEKSDISRIILTASGGPFYNYTPLQLAEVTAEEALRHPTWKMGKKVTIDSSTLMNKGFEAIEAHWLFSVPFNKIEIVIHPQSVVHSLVEFADSTVKAQLSIPDMRFPIQYALFYPERIPNNNLPRISLTDIATLDFKSVNYHNFPCLSLALETGQKGGTYPAVLCAADEIAVELFLNHQIKFSDIPEIITETVSSHKNVVDPDLDEIMLADSWAREKLKEIAANRGLLCC